MTLDIRRLAERRRGVTDDPVLRDLNIEYDEEVDIRNMV